MIMEEYRSIQKIVPSITRHSHMVLTYGTFHSDSNFELAIDAFDIVYRKVLRRNDGEKLKLVIAGNYNSCDSSQRAYYKHLVQYACAKRSAEDILLITSLTTVTKKTLLTYSLAFVYTCLKDMSARQILEAMYIGRPVIAPVNNVTEEYLPKDTGYLIRPTATCFARAILALLDDYKLAEQYGNNAKVHFSKNLSFVQFVQKLKDIFNDGVVMQHSEQDCLSILECYSQIGV